MEQEIDKRLQQAAIEAFKELVDSDRNNFFEIFKAGAQWGMKDAIKNVTITELKAELKRRVELAKAQKAEEMKNALRCRNCKHCVPHPSFYANMFLCNARTWGKKYPRHYCVKPSQKACDKFECKMEE